MTQIADYIRDELGVDSLPEYEVKAGELITTSIEEKPELVIEQKEAVHLPAIVEPAQIEIIKPESYEFTVGGISYQATTSSLHRATQRENQAQLSFISSLILVVADACDDVSGNWGRVVRFETPNQVPKQMFLKNSDIATNGAVVLKSLIDAGLRVSTDSKMREALMNYLNLTPPSNKVLGTCLDRTGWHGNVYLLQDNTVIGEAEKPMIFSGTLSGIKPPKGTVEEWRSNVACLCRGNSLLILSVCVAFASALLRPLRIESGGYHIFGESSTGKSTTLHVAASVFGDPEMVIGPWRATANGTEGKAKRCNDGLMILDELHQASPKEAGDAAYMIMNGKGKQRANVLGDAREVFDWRVNCLSSGEVAYAAFISSGGTGSRAGQEVRMLDISADTGSDMGIFENIHNAIDSHTFAEELKKACSQSYGTPIRTYLERLVPKIDQLEEEYLSWKDAFFDSYVPDEASGQVKRVASKFAVAVLAGEIATNMGLTGWEENEALEAVGKTFESWLSTRGTAGQQEAEKAVEQVKSFLRCNGMSRFMSVRERSSGGYAQEGSDRTINNMAGYRVVKMDNVYEYVVYPHVFTGEICQGLNYSTVLKTLTDRGYLVIERNKPQVRRRMPGSTQARYYHFTSTIMDDVEEVGEDPEATHEDTGLQATID